MNTYGFGLVYAMEFAVNPHEFGAMVLLDHFAVEFAVQHFRCGPVSMAYHLVSTFSFNSMKNDSLLIRKNSKKYNAK